MVEITDYFYEPSSSFVAQGNAEVIRKYEEKGYQIMHGGNGSYRMARPSKPTIFFKDDNGIDRYQSVRELISQCYGIQRISEKRFLQFIDDCKSGKFELKYSWDKGLYI